jgi:putative MFS transporter
MTGMLVGGIVFGIIGDKFGRKKTLFGSIILYSIANIANSFIDSFAFYAFWRFIAGVGLAGELGGCISLVAETLSPERRGFGTALVATIGVFGAVVGGLLAELVTWRTNYRIGGGMGLCLLILRRGVKESKMFESAKASYNVNNISRGNILAFFTNKKLFITYAYCIMIGLPTWFIVGILV